MTINEFIQEVKDRKINKDSVIYFYNNHGDNVIEKFHIRVGKTPKHIVFVECTHYTQTVRKCYSRMKPRQNKKHSTNTTQAT